MQEPPPKKYGFRNRWGGKKKYGFLINKWRRFLISENPQRREKSFISRISLAADERDLEYWKCFEMCLVCLVYKFRILGSQLLKFVALSKKFTSNFSFLHQKLMDLKFHLLLWTSTYCFQIRWRLSLKLWATKFSNQSAIFPRSLIHWWKTIPALLLQYSREKWFLLNNSIYQTNEQTKLALSSTSRCSMKLVFLTFKFLHMGKKLNL